MSEWWSYRLSDFLLFSARTYYRLFELYNVAVWPAGQVVAVIVGLALVFLALRGGVTAARSACVLLAGCWLWVAWAFHWQRYATVNWAAAWFAAAFALQGLLLLFVGGASARLRFGALRGLRAYAGLGLLLFSLLAQPWLGVLFGGSWRQAELFGLVPDPSVIGTLGLLLLLRPVDDARPGLARWLWPIPLLWCGISAATLWTMHAPDGDTLGAGPVRMTRGNAAGVLPSFLSKKFSLRPSRLPEQPSTLQQTQLLAWFAARAAGSR